MNKSNSNVQSGEIYCYTLCCTLSGSAVTVTLGHDCPYPYCGNPGGEGEIGAFFTTCIWQRRWNGHRPAFAMGTLQSFVYNSFSSRDCFCNRPLVPFYSESPWWDSAPGPRRSEEGGLWCILYCSCGDLRWAGFRERGKGILCQTSLCSLQAISCQYREAEDLYLPFFLSSSFLVASKKA